MHVNVPANSPANRIDSINTPYAQERPFLCWYNLHPTSPPFLIITIHISHQPIHALIYTSSINRTTRHNTPIPILKLAQLQRLADLPRALCARLVLLVRKDQQRGVAQFFLVEHGGEFFGSGGEAVDVGAVDDEDYRGGVGIVAAPVRSDGGLAAEVLGGCIRTWHWWSEERRKRTQTLKLRFLYVTDSTLKPMVGIVVTTSPI